MRRLKMKEKLPDFFNSKLHLITDLRVCFFLCSPSNQVTVTRELN